MGTQTKIYPSNNKGRQHCVVVLQNLAIVCVQLCAIGNSRPAAIKLCMRPTIRHCRLGPHSAQAIMCKDTVPTVPRAGKLFAMEIRSKQLGTGRTCHVRSYRTNVRYLLPVRKHSQMNLCIATP